MKYLKLYEQKDLSEIEPGDIIRTKEQPWADPMFSVVIELDDNDLCFLLISGPVKNLIYKHIHTIRSEDGVIMSINRVNNNRIRYFIKLMLEDRWGAEIVKLFNDILEKWRKSPKLKKIIDQEMINIYAKKYNL